jgi:hypothetical protein
VTIRHLIEKFWPTNYARRGAAYLSEGTGEMRNRYGNIAAPLNGYIWDACNRQNITVRSSRGGVATRAVTAK